MNYLAAGFVAVWLLVMIYVVFMAVRQGKLEQEMANLEEVLQEKRAKCARREILTGQTAIALKNAGNCV